MRNGIIDNLEMMGIGKSIDKIVKLRKKYESTRSTIVVSERISIEFAEHFKTCYICVNNERAIKYIYGNMRGLVKSVATGVTLGAIKSPIKFLTSDKTIANHTFITETSELLKSQLPQIERLLQQDSAKKWGGGDDSGFTTGSAAL